MFSDTFLDASKASLLLDPVIKLSKFLLGSILLYWKKKSLINDTLSLSLEKFMFLTFVIFLISCLFSSKESSILFISGL